MSPPPQLFICTVADLALSSSNQCCWLKFHFRYCDVHFYYWNNQILNRKAMTPCDHEAQVLRWPPVPQGPFWATNTSLLTFADTNAQNWHHRFCFDTTRSNINTGDPPGLHVTLQYTTFIKIRKQTKLSILISHPVLLLADVNHNHSSLTVKQNKGLQTGLNFIVLCQTKVIKRKCSLCSYLEMYSCKT